MTTEVCWCSVSEGLACFLAHGFDRWHRPAIAWPARVAAGRTGFVNPVAFSGRPVPRPDDPGAAAGGGHAG